jgi:hypothetical protein
MITLLPPRSIKVHKTHAVACFGWSCHRTAGTVVIWLHKLYESNEISRISEKPTTKNRKITQVTLNLFLWLKPKAITHSHIKMRDQTKPRFLEDISNIIPRTLANRCKKTTPLLKYGPGSVVRIATGYGLDGPGIESR